MMSCQKSLLAFACLVLLQATGVRANEGDVLNLSATLSSMRDDNLFRLAPSVDPKSVGLDGKSDTITTMALGLNFNKLFGLQRLIANVSLVDNRYKTNDYLDFQALNYDAKWLWAVGTRWTGELAVDRNESLNSFSDYRNFRVRNVRTIENERFSANYWFHSNWAAVVGVSRYSLANEQPFLADSDYDANGYNYGLRYRPLSGNTVTVRAKHLDGTYSKRQFNSTLQYDNGFVQDSYELDADWRLTGKSQVRGRLEYLARKHDHFADRDYDGWVGNLDFAYAATAKGSLNLGYKHGLETFQQLTSSYYVLDEVTLATKWAATSTLTATARLGYGLRSYKGEIVALPAGTEQREDKFTRVGFDLAYLPVRWVELKAGVAYENRNVNYDSLDYKDRIGFVSASAQY